MLDRTAKAIMSPSAPMRHLRDAFRRPRRLVEGASLATDSWPLPPFISVEDAVQLVEDILEQHDPRDVLDAYARAFPLGLTPGIAIGATYAPTIGHAIDHIARYASRETGLDRIQLHRGDGLTFLVLSQHGDLRRLGMLEAEVGLGWIAERLRQMRPSASQAVSFDFRHAPIGDPARYDNRFGCHVNFRQEINALSFPTSWERINNPVGELDLFQLAKSRCERDIAVAQRMDSYGLMRMRVAEFIAATGRPPKLKELALQQGCSQRTIMRRLSVAGTNFQDLVDSIQMRRASEMLESLGASVEAAAERLGYSDASSFRRSFHRWFGVNPGEWRRGGRSPDRPAS